MSRCLLLVACGLTSLFAQSPGRRLTTLQRVEASHLEAVRQARQRWARDRQGLPPVGIYEDFRAILHVHAEDADHTQGTRAEVLRAAKAAGVRAIMFTDHNGPRADTWHGLRDGVLFIPGGEGDHFLRFPASGADPELAFLSHLEDRPDMPADGFIGTEIYNRHSDAKEEREFNDYFWRAMKDPAESRKLGVIMKQYPDELFGAGTNYMPLFIGRWDKETQARPFTGIAANDSHQNQIFNGTVFDPYEVSFRSVSTHILAAELTEHAIRQSLREGRVYVAHDWLADPAGFSFVASNNLGVFDMGDPVPLVGTTRLGAQLPLSAHLKLIHNGGVVSDTNGSSLSFTVKEPGAYRVEAWLAVDGEERPWIYSNPLYISRPSPESMRLPSTELAPNVEARRDIPYTEGKPEDTAKHKLDIYLPKDRTSPPVFVFLHGGAWRSGDRSTYTALGNRFAKEGILTVIPSYRLAPANPHPAQIEDAAAAFAWVVRSIAQHGGDPKRIYLGGHSAGGHLAALLALDERYLKKHGIPAAAIRGVIAMSGVYEIRGMDAVFGTADPAKRDASPLQHVKASAPPFLITYCQWDYLTLPAQARRFHAALEKAGVRSQLVFIPRLGHITEMVNIWKDDDPTARAVLGFIRK